MAYIGRQPAVAALTASDITDGIVSNAKLAQDIISADTALGAAPADTDELLVSDAGTLKRMDYSYIKAANTPAWSAYNNAAQDVLDATATTVIFNTERFDTASAFASNTFTVPAGQGGKYFLSAGVRFEDGAYGRYIRLFIDGSQSNTIGNMGFGTVSYGPDNLFAGVVALSAGDAVTIVANQHSGETKPLEGLSDGWYRSYFIGFKIIE